MTLSARLGGLLICCISWLSGAAAAVEPIAVPVLSARVTDLTATLSGEQKGGIESELRGIEQSTGAQLAVLLVPTTKPESIEQYSLRVVEQWRLGRKGRDDGVLLLVAKNDRKLRIEVGYGLEGAIPDAAARRVIDETIAPRFKAGDFAGGLVAGIHQLAGMIAGQGGADAAKDSQAATAAPPREDTVAAPLMLDLVRDMSGTLDPDFTWRMSQRLREFYDSGRTMPVFVLVVPSTGGEPIDDYTKRVLRHWGETAQLDVDRSLLMVIARDERTAHAEAGEGLRARLPPGAMLSLVAEVAAPPLAKGDIGATVEAVVPAIERMIDDAMANKPMSEIVSEASDNYAIAGLVALVVVGTILRWVIGPLLGGLTMGGFVGAGAWFLSGELTVGLIAGAVAFVFVLVGVSNWISIFASGSGGGRSGGGFSGGGGSFGGGGASGSW
jgi:uncharacterized membrane protein YgcG